MIRLPTFVPVLFFVAFTTTSTRGEEPEWKACVDPQFSYVLKYPPALAPLSGQATSGCSFQTTDGEFNVEAVMETPADGGAQSVDTRMQKELDLMADTVTYKTSGDTWFVISGVTADGTEYYRKLFTNGERWISLRITYPHARNAKYDPWVSRMEKSFVPFAKSDMKAAAD